jgi:hypothetical protein
MKDAAALPTRARGGARACDRAVDYRGGQLPEIGITLCTRNSGKVGTAGDPGVPLAAVPVALVGPVGCANVPTICTR